MSDKQSKKQNFQEAEVERRSEAALKKIVADPNVARKFVDDLSISPEARFKDKVFRLCLRFTRNQALPFLPMIIALYVSIETGGDVLSHKNILLMICGACLLFQFVLSVRGAVIFFRAHEKVFNQVYRRQRTMRETTHSSTTPTGKIIRIGFVASIISSVLVAIVSTTYLVVYSVSEGYANILSENQFVVIPILIALQALCGINYHTLGREMKEELGTLVDTKRDATAQ